MGHKYILKLYDMELLHFDVVRNLAHPEVEITWIDQDKTHLLPLGMEVSDKGLSEWISHRSIPRNRAYVGALLAKCGLSMNRPMDIISVCRGLSLNDSYWVVTDSESRSFDECNLYEHRLNRVLAWTAFTGYGSSSQRSLLSSPEFTTNGMLPKCWRRDEGKLLLFKGGTSGASNTGNEPFSEMYASQLGKEMDIDCTMYRIRKWKGMLCSSCEIFTGKDVAFVPVGRIVKTGGIQAVREYLQALGPDFLKQYRDMIVFDAIIYNTDRHFGNFGFLVDSHTNKIMAPAPLFDHGNSLFNLAGDFWESEGTIRNYAATLQPRVYDDFLEEARSCMDHEMRQRLRHLLNFEFRKSGKWNYPEKKLQLMSQMVRERIRMLVGADNG